MAVNIAHSTPDHERRRLDRADAVCNLPRLRIMGRQVDEEDVDRQSKDAQS